MSDVWKKSIQTVPKWQWESRVGPSQVSKATVTCSAQRSNASAGHAQARDPASRRILSSLPDSFKGRSPGLPSLHPPIHSPLIQTLGTLVRPAHSCMPEAISYCRATTNNRKPHLKIGENLDGLLWQCLIERILINFLTHS